MFVLVFASVLRVCEATVTFIHTYCVVCAGVLLSGGFWVADSLPGWQLREPDSPHQFSMHGDLHSGVLLPRGLYIAYTDCVRMWSGARARRVVTCVRAHNLQPAGVLWEITALPAAL